MVTMATQFWVVVSVVHAPVQTVPTVDATLLLLVTRTTVTDRLSATVTRVTQVKLTSSFVPPVPVLAFYSSPSESDAGVPMCVKFT